jgi:hypothetical protein
MFCTKPLKLNSNSAKHFPLFISCEKYIFDDTNSEASTDFVYDKSFSQHIYKNIIEYINKKTIDSKLM